MAALVQPYPTPAGTITMLQSRSPSSSTTSFGTSGASVNRSSPSPRGAYHGSAGHGTGYRSPAAAAPIAPYAFTATPSLAGSTAHALRHQNSAPFLQPGGRTSSAPVLPATRLTSAHNTSRQRQSIAFPVPITVDPASTPAPASNQPLSQRSLDLALPDGKLSAMSNSSRPSPDRYRRQARRADTSAASSLSGASSTTSTAPSGSGMSAVGHLYQQPSQSLSSPSLRSYDSSKRSSKDDTALSRTALDAQKRYRRRSLSMLTSDEVKAVEVRPAALAVPVQAPAPMPARTYASVVSGTYLADKKDNAARARSPAPKPVHGRHGSTDSISSASVSRPSSTREDAINGSAATFGTPIAKHEAKMVNVPARGSSDTHKRAVQPSPLSQPMPLTAEGSTSQRSFAQIVSRGTTEETEPTALPKAPESSAAAHLAAVSRKDGRGAKPSRLRRAFSFGSAAELRKASAENSAQANALATANRANKLHKDQFSTPEEAREAAIVQQQEAGGLGASIYSQSQGQFYTGSTDNLSISSTASSASLMLRKMGKGMKKSTRSLVGIFRPKSIAEPPASSGSDSIPHIDPSPPVLPEPNLTQVSMVTVEAEREKVNVNLDPHDQAGGGTGFPRLERNSIDAASLDPSSEPALSFSDHSSDHTRPRRSIVGSDKDRAEVLTAVKKGILKRNGTDSGNSSPVPRVLDAPPTLATIPRISESPQSSAPSTPVSDRGSSSATLVQHRRNDSVTIEGEDYFVSVARFAAAQEQSKSLPGTPRNISFSPRIQFHDTWCSEQYDRRGEIATCNRLTPTLAQAIKEELNSFKMEMEVHESSKVYTHFF